jgi:guanylate kinase
LFIEAESVGTLLDRLVKRDKGTTLALDERKASIQREMVFAPFADHRIINREGKLQETVIQINALMDA